MKQLTPCTYQPVRQLQQNVKQCKKLSTLMSGCSQVDLQLKCMEAAAVLPGQSQIWDFTYLLPLMISRGVFIAVKQTASEEAARQCQISCYALDKIKQTCEWHAAPLATDVHLEYVASCCDEAPTFQFQFCISSVHAKSACYCCSG